MDGNDFVIFWVVAAFFLTISFGLFFVFCCRCGMLKDQDRARWLPLWAGTGSEFKVKSSKFKVDENRAGKGSNNP